MAPVDIVFQGHGSNNLNMVSFALEELVVTPLALDSALLKDVIKGLKDVIKDLKTLKAAILDRHEPLLEQSNQLLKRLFPKKDTQFLEIVSLMDYQQLLQLLPISQKIRFPSDSLNEKLLPLNDLIEPFISDSNSLLVTFNIQKMNIYQYKVYLDILPRIMRNTIIVIILYYTINIQYLISYLKKLIKTLIQLQWNKVTDGISGDPTTQKKEPPIGGVKVGGKQYDFSHHIAKKLYPKTTLELVT